MRKTCYKRNFSNFDISVSANGDWNKLLATHGNCLYQLPLDVILKNNVALSYLLDFMSMIGSQAYLFFLLNAEGNLREICMLLI